MNFHTDSPAGTRRLGEALAPMLQPGDVLVMRGDMGAGKSEFTRGVARGLGVTGYVTSPSFTVLQVHESGRLPLYHFDWYRVSGPEELYELSMDEYLYGEGVSVIEWPSMAWEVVPAAHLEITLTPVSETGRDIAFQAVGGFHALDEKRLSEVTL